VTGYSNGQNRITVAKADAADSSKMPSIGLAFSDYSQNDNGQVTTIGSIEDIDTQVTNDFQEGDVVYVASGGGLTNVKPTGTNLIQNVGKVGRRQQNNGEIVVMAIGRSNDVPNIPNGQAWIGNASGVATPTTLATVATSGSYNDLLDQPTIPTDTNLGNTDQTLSAERAVEMGGNNLIFENSSAEVAKIFPQGYVQATGRTIVNGNGSIGGLINLKDADSSNGVTLRCPTTVSSDLTLILPDSDGSSGQVLKTDGSGNLSFGNAVSRGGTYSWSGYATDVAKTSTFYYQFPSATATSSSTDMISGFVGQGISNGTYGSNGALTLDGLSSTDSATYSMTIKVTTNATIAIQTVSPAAGQFVPATQFAFSNPSEQTFTLTQTSPTACLSSAGKQWILGVYVTFFAAGSIDFRVEDLSITVS
jgi:co-chaperonin GroES (HSP10)